MATVRTKTVDYFFFNTNKDVIVDQPLPRFGILIDQGFAAVGGSRKLFGEQLRQLLPEDILLMYENGVGIVAVGRVLEQWDERGHTHPLYYTPREVANFTTGKHEYRIAVDWFIDLSQSPISTEQARDRIGFISSRTLQRIVKGRANVEDLIDEIRTTH